MAQFFYDQQIRRFVIQFARIMSNWNVTFGRDRDGNPIIVRVPIQYGNASRQAATIIAKNSASNLPTAPMMSFYITGVDYDQRRTQDPYFIQQVNVRQRALNPDTGEYETTQGDAFTIERIMPVPYTLRVQCDFWTTNEQQKHELFEQIGVLFNPSMEIQSTDNFIDWTALSVVYQDGITWSSRTIPQGTGNDIDVLSWKFYMPIWISSPVKVRKLGVIYKIIASIFEGAAVTDMQDDDLLLGTRQKITAYGYKVLLLGNSLQILPQGQVEQPPNSSYDLPTSPDTDIYWSAVLNEYGNVRSGLSMIALENPYLTNEIRGTIAFNPNDDRLLIFNVDIDTLPSNTLAAVDRVIDPQTTFPGQDLPPAANGQRYLITEDLGPQTTPTNPNTNGTAWPGLENGASANDIIEYDGTEAEWFVSFDSSAATEVEFVTNLTSQVQYRWDGTAWMKSFEGWYEAGDWSVII